jgi:FkbM family methyltransferase
MGWLLGRLVGLAAVAERRFARLQGKGLGSTVAQELDQALSFSSREGLFVDVGGNKGEYTADLLKRVPNARVRVYEPSKLNVGLLRERFADEAGVEVYGFGLADNDSDAVLFADKEGSGLASLVKRRLEHVGRSFDWAEPVATRRFAAHWATTLKKQEISLFKIDVEGLEMSVLLGMGDAIEHCEVIQFEFGGTHIDSRSFFRDFWHFFEGRSFDIYRIAPRGPVRVSRYSESDEYFAGPTNFLAVRRELQGL